MPWKGQTMEEQRETFVRRVLEGEKTKTALCQEYEISRPTGDKWIGRYMRDEPMKDQSKAPFHTPGRTSAAIESLIVDLRKAHPAMGAKKLRRVLENQGKQAPAYSTINAILHRNNLITKEASAAATPHVRFEKAQPNEMWQADFKGHFALESKGRCHPLAILDDHSRFNVCLDAKENERYEGTHWSFTKAFERYGLPDSMLFDNGNPWGTSQSTGYTSLEVWLMDLGILPKHGRIGHPQTQGKEERFNGTLKCECLKWHTFKDCLHAQCIFDEFRAFYNNERPHHALNLDTPSQKFRPSARKLPSRIDDWEYGQDVKLARVKSSGYIHFRGQGYFLSEAFARRQIGLQEDSSQSGVFLVRYRGFCVAMLSIVDRVVIAKRPYLISREHG